MSFDLPEGINPFEAPRAGIGAEALYLDLADNDAELVRREHLGREAAIRSLGRVGYLGSGVTGFFAILLGLMAAGAISSPPNQPNGMDLAFQKAFMGAAAAIYLVASVILGGLGYGLAHLQVWARWATVVLGSLALIYVAFSTLVLSYLVNPVAGLVVGVVGGGLNGMIVYLLVSRKSGVVFSPEYREVIRQTPHIRQRTSVIVKVLLVILAAVVTVGVLAAILGGGQR